MELFSYLNVLYQNMSYRKKLLLSYLLFIFVPMILLSLYFTLHTGKIMREHSAMLSQMHLTSSAEIISSRFSEMLALSRTLSRQKTLREILAKEPGLTDITEQGEDLQSLDRLLNTVYYDSSLYSVRIFVNPGFSYADRQVCTWSLDSVNALFPGKYEQMLKMPALAISSDTVSLTMPVYGLADFERAIALICIDISQEELIRLMRLADFSGNGEIWLVDAGYRPLFGYSNADDSVLLPQQAKLPSQNDSLTAISSRLPGAYYLVTSSPAGTLPGRGLFPLQLALFALVTGCIIYWLASLYAGSVSRRIRNLSETMQQARQGNLQVHCIVDSADEIGSLQSDFNDMIRQMRQMLETQYQTGQRLKDHELKLLQAQIDPHFLYNTLDLINWTARNRNVEEVCELVQKLSRYYRISLSKGKEVILLKQELEHVSLYVGLQNKRFDGKIRLHISMQQELSRIPIPKLLLQPLVENSIVHGFDNREETITLTIGKEDRFLSIRLADDGAGISAQKLACLRLSLELKQYDDSDNGYGLHNIVERIRHYYGESASFEIESAPDAGTCVLIRLPLDTRYSSEPMPAA